MVVFAPVDGSTLNSMTGSTVLAHATAARVTVVHVTALVAMVSAVSMTASRWGGFGPSRGRARAVNRSPTWASVGAGRVSEAQGWLPLARALVPARVTNSGAWLDQVRLGVVETPRHGPIPDR